MTFRELGTFSFRYQTLGVHGMGISSSSNFAVLYRASQIYLKDRAPFDLKRVADQALTFERHLADVDAIAADDVYPITYGGVVKVHTQPNRFVRSTESAGTRRIEYGPIRVEAVEFDPTWIAEHAVVAIRPGGERHEIPSLLRRLWSNRTAARRFVTEISGLADQAARAIHRRNVQGLARAVNAYRGAFDDWTKQRLPGERSTPSEYFTSNVSRMADLLKKRFPTGVLAWKPPGGGASESLIVIVRDKEARDLVIDLFESQEWSASPVFVTGGICGEFMRHDGEVRITAGHRLDFVGAADLGQSVHIGAAGVCCSCAIEPRTEIVFKPIDSR